MKSIETLVARILRDGSSILRNQDSSCTSPQPRLTVLSNSDRTVVLIWTPKSTYAEFVNRYRRRMELALKNMTATLKMDPTDVFNYRFTSRFVGKDKISSKLNFSTSILCTSLLKFIHKMRWEPFQQLLNDFEHFRCRLSAASSDLQSRSDSLAPKKCHNSPIESVKFRVLERII